MKYTLYIKLKQTSWIITNDKVEIREQGQETE